MSRRCSEHKRAKLNPHKKTSAMLKWANKVAMAATWQERHQLAYWKARTIALYYENKMLREVLRRNGLEVPKEDAIFDAEFKLEGEDSEDSDNKTENDTDRTESEQGSDANKDEDIEDDEDELEVSEEFIEFLIQNAKFKEDAKRERELLKAKLAEESKADVPEPPESVEDKVSRMKELYGERYKRIMALEMYLKSNFQNEMDKGKATYWPNIPFNFNTT